MLAGGYRGCLEWFGRRLAVLIFYELHETHSLQMEPWLDVFARRFRPKIGERKAVVPQAHDADTVPSFEKNRGARAVFWLRRVKDGRMKQRVVSLVVLDCRCCCSVKLQALVYNILPSTTAVFSYAIGSRKLSANEQFFVGAQTVVSLLQTTQIKQGVSFIAANTVYTSTNKTTIV